MCVNENRIEVHESFDVSEIERFMHFIKVMMLIEFIEWGSCSAENICYSTLIEYNYILWLISIKNILRLCFRFLPSQRIKQAWVGIISIPSIWRRVLSDTRSTWKIHWIYGAYNKSFDNYICFVSDNTPANKTFSNRTGIHKFGCYIHRSNLEMKDIKTNQENIPEIIINKIISN